MNKALIWLYTHCKAIGMSEKSDSGKLEEDIALFTIRLQEQIQKNGQTMLERDVALRDLDELKTLVKVLRAYTWTPNNQPDPYRDHKLYPVKHKHRVGQLWAAINAIVNKDEPA